jgi:hypothetical protein
VAGMTGVMVAWYGAAEEEERIFFIIFHFL